MLALTYPPGARVQRCQDFESESEVRREEDDNKEERSDNHNNREKTKINNHPHRCADGDSKFIETRNRFCNRVLQFALFVAVLAIGSQRHSNIFNRNSVAAAVALGSALRGVRSQPILDPNADPGVRSERSANLSLMTGSSREIQMYVKNRHLQILPDGTVNGSNDDTSDFTIFQRSSVSTAQLKIQGVATCLYLCMDSCGLLYGSREYTEDCLFTEDMEHDNYNTYSSVRWSTPQKTLYLGLSRHGEPRRVQARKHNLGRLSAYARVLTQKVSGDRLKEVHQRMSGARHNVRHRHGEKQAISCPAPPVQERDGRDRFRCRKRKKRKKRRRRCRQGENPGPQCEVREANASPSSGNGAQEQRSKRLCGGGGNAGSESCRREGSETPVKKWKAARVEEDEEQLDDDEQLAAFGERKSRRLSSGKKGGGRHGGRKRPKGGRKAPKPGKGQRNPGAKRKGPGLQRFPRTTTTARGFGDVTPVTAPFPWSAEPPTGPSAWGEIGESVATPSSLFREPDGARNAASVASTLTLASTTAVALGIAVVNRAASGDTEASVSASAAPPLPDIGESNQDDTEIGENEELLDFNDFDEEEEEREEEDEETIIDDMAEGMMLATNQGKRETGRRLAM